MTAKPWNAIQRGIDKKIDDQTRKKEVFNKNIIY
jgi:hypothetical protein